MPPKRRFDNDHAFRGPPARPVIVDRSRPTYLVNIETGAGIPHVISVRPFLPAGRRAFNEQRVVELLAAEIRNQTNQAVREYTGWSANRVNQRVTGYLQAYNLQNGGNHTHDELANLADLNTEMIMDIIGRLQQSNEDLFIFDLEWRFTIDPNSIVVGGNKNVRIPSFYVSHEMRKTWVCF